jgi:1-phosphofructokinase family hexose kinase
VTTPQILCLSANPSIDRRIHLHSLALGHVNRAQSVEAFAGGKAAHVAMSAKALGAGVTWLGFLGGATGEEFASEFRKLRFNLACVRSQAPTRMNLELLHDSGKITEVLEPGEKPTQAELAKMLRMLGGYLRRRWRGSLLAISGSLPHGVRPGFYSSLIEAARSAGSPVFLDTSGEALRASLANRPDFVKPNREETEKILGRKLKDRAAVLDAATELIRRGAGSAAISLGAEGLVWVEGGGGPAWWSRPPRLKAISTVGCGDATVGGFAFASVKSMTGEKALRLATACGAANCLARFPGRISLKQVISLMPQIEIRRID